MTARTATGRRRAWQAAGTLAVVGIAVGAVLGRTESPPTSRSTGSSVIQQYPAAERVDVAPFNGQLLDGGMFDSSSLAGTVAVVNVWGSWCVPCRAEAPALVDVAMENAGRVSFLGLNVRDSPDAARAFERRNGVPYPSIRAEDANQALLAFGTSFAMAAVPTTVVLDSRGRVAARVVGPTTRSTLRALVADVAAEAPGGPTPAG